MEPSRQRAFWARDDRRRKEPSLYDEYLNQEKKSSSQQNTPQLKPVVLSRDNSANTIRTVTPDSSNINNRASHTTIAEEGSSAPAFDSGFLPLFSPTGSLSGGGTLRKKEKASPRSLTRGVLGRSESTDATRRDHLGARTGYVGGSSSSSSRRPRTRTLEDTTRDKSPVSLLPRNRMRHGSMHTNTPSHSHSANDSISSIGHQGVVSPLSQTSFSSTSTAPPPRPASPVSTIASTSDSMSGSLPQANAKRILHLMKTLCGRMSGNLLFRRRASDPWQSSYCYIDDEVGSLMCEPDQDSGHHHTLVYDLRGCQVKPVGIDDETQYPYLDISVPNNNLELHVRLKDRSDFDSWYAALLCWQPIRPKGMHNRMAKPQSPVLSGHPISGKSSRRNSEMSSVQKEVPVIKAGPMIYWDSNMSYSNATTPRAVGRPQVPRMQSYGTLWWRRVSCTLREDGELKLFAESGSNLLSVVQLNHLSRCAIQRLDPSVLDNEFCIAIYPQYTTGGSVAPSIRPIYLSLESRVLFEVWFVLLRAFTIPQLYGPKPATPDDDDDNGSRPQAVENSITNNGTDMFRMERSLTIRIVEAKLPHPTMSTRAEFNHQQAVRQGQWPPSPQHQDGHYVEILLDNESRGKTQVKHEGTSPFWREEFEYLNLPTVLSSASVLLRRRPPDLTSAREQHELRLVHEAYGLLETGHNPARQAGYTGISHDQTLGKVEIHLEELEGSKEVEKWWPALNSYGESAGEILIKARAEENVILMSRDYEPLGNLLHKFDNELTLQIAQMIPGELRRLSEILLNVFQVSGKVEEWLCSLVEEEIDGVHKDTPASRLRYSRRMGSDAENAHTISASSERELLVRDMNKNATLEANLLFRGNTLLTKSLDSYMRRVGKEYLTSVLGQIIKDLNDKDPDCEVDPNRVQNDRALERNWERLLQNTRDVWTAIRSSANRAPIELKVIFRHIRACAEDRYGDFLRSVSFSSVSGFLFLRFFCPAVLNPKLFGLLKDDPKPRARRTFTLIAKSLQGLANMASFGSKEHWMARMNEFLGDHRESFKSFIDDVCTLPIPDGNEKATRDIPHSYSTPFKVRDRLPYTYRDGFPSLPYLIDQGREFAGLVELWLQGTSGKDGSEGIATAIGKEDGDLLNFHTLCAQLQSRTQDCLARAERAERPNSALSFRWEELIDQLQGTNAFGLPSRPQSKDGISEVDEEDFDEPRLVTQAELDDLETPTRASFDSTAMRAAGEAAARARGALTLGVIDGSTDNLLEGDIHTLQDFEADRDGGAASVAASMLQQDHSTQSLDRRAGFHWRGSFDMPRSGGILSGNSSVMSAGSSHGNAPPPISANGTFLPREPTTSSLRDRLERDREIARDIEHSLGGGRRNLPASASGPLPGLRGSSAHGSAASGSAAGSETDSNATTALPSWTREKERRDRERERLKKREKEERERRLKDFVPLAGMVGGFRKGRKDRKDKEKEEREGRSGPGD